MSDDGKLERGMLLLDPGEGRPSIYAVAGHDGTKPVLVQQLPEVLVRKTLHRNALPDGWSVLPNRALAQLALDAAFKDDQPSTGGDAQ